MNCIYIKITKIKTNIPNAEELISFKGFNLITFCNNEDEFEFEFEFEYIPSYIKCGNFERRNNYMKVTYNPSKIDENELSVLKSVSVDITDEEFYNIPKYK